MPISHLFVRSFRFSHILDNARHVHWAIFFGLAVLTEVFDVWFLLEIFYARRNLRVGTVWVETVRVGVRREGVL